MHAAGVNPDGRLVRTGTYTRKPGLPYAGTDGAGQMSATGNAVVGLDPGQRVALAGGVGRRLRERTPSTSSPTRGR